MKTLLSKDGIPEQRCTREFSNGKRDGDVHITPHGTIAGVTLLLWANYLIHDGSLPKSIKYK